jgi:hypothetical protein
VQKYVFTPKCTVCHSGSSPLGGLDLVEGHAYGNIVNVPAGELSSMDRVEPGDADKSYLYLKVIGAHLEAGGSGDQMPQGGPYLDATLKELIAGWINTGASEDCGTAARPAPAARPMTAARPAPAASTR